MDIVGIVLAIVGGALGTSSIVSLFFSLGKAVRSERHMEGREMYIQRFFTELDRLFDLGVVKNLDDVQLIQRTIVTKQSQSILAAQDTRTLLELYLSKVESKERYELIKELLQQAGQSKPFSMLPDSDREIALRLDGALEAGDTERASNELAKLATSVGTKLQVTENQLKSSRIWTRVGAYGTIAGLVLTVVVGVLVGLFF